MKLVIDTSIIIDKLRGGTKWDQFFETTDIETEFFIPTITIFELFSGSSSKDPIIMDKINKIIYKFKRVELSDTIAQKAGELYRDVSPTLDIPDYIISATAIGIGAKVVTLNTKHFQKIPGLQIYSF